jgi:hypothetical protein
MMPMATMAAMRARKRSLRTARKLRRRPAWVSSGRSLAAGRSLGARVWALWTLKMAATTNTQPNSMRLARGINQRPRGPSDISVTRRPPRTLPRRPPLLRTTIRRLACRGSYISLTVDQNPVMRTMIKTLAQTQKT